MLEDKPKEPVVVYRPPPKKIVEPKPEIEEVVIREVRERKPPRIILEPEPRPEVEEIVVREPRPPVRTIVYEPQREERPKV